MPQLWKEPFFDFPHLLQHEEVFRAWAHWTTTKSCLYFQVPRAKMAKNVRVTLLVDKVDVSHDGFTQSGNRVGHTPKGH